MENKKQNKEIKVQTIQSRIFGGSKVLLKSVEKETTLVRIIYNNSDTDGTKKWRIIIEKDEYYTSEIKISCPARTSTETLEEITEKHHIVCDSKLIIFENNIATIF